MPLQLSSALSFFPKETRCLPATSQFRFLDSYFTYSIAGEAPAQGYNKKLKSELTLEIFPVSRLDFIFLSELCTCKLSFLDI